MVKLAHNINLRVFCSQDEDRQLIAQKLKLLLPFDLEKEKIAIEDQISEGFNKSKIIILSITLTKDRHMNHFIESFLTKLGNEKSTLLDQLESRLDKQLDFYIRLDKNLLLRDKFVLTDSGRCYHIKISMAAYPKKREKVVAKLKELLKA